MTPLRAAILLALEKACRANIRARGLGGYESDVVLVSAGATVAMIGSYVEYSGLVRSSAIRRILIEERVAGRVLQDVVDVAHRWWPVGLAAKLKDGQ